MYLLLLRCARRMLGPCAGWTSGTAAGAARGTEIMRYGLRLTNASIGDIRFHMRNSPNPTLARHVEYDETAFVYRSIEWAWVPKRLGTRDSLLFRRAPTARVAARMCAAKKARAQAPNTRWACTPRP
jgi:hypothetical protein